MATVISNPRVESSPGSNASGLFIVRIEPPRGWFALRLGELWNYRELLYFFVWRDVKIRYKQTAIGVVWVVLQPLLTMLVATLFLAGLPNCRRKDSPTLCSASPGWCPGLTSPLPF